MIKSTFSSEDFEIVKNDVLYQGVYCLKQYRVHHRLFDGGWSNTIKREIVERLSAAAILLYDPKRDEVVLIEQFRAGALKDKVSPWLFEIVAGLIENNENPKDVAIREAMEEAGCKVLEVVPICDYYVSPGGSNEYVHLYCGKVDSTNVCGIHGLEEEGENIRALCLPVAQAFQEVQNNGIKTAPANIALMWLQLNHTRLKSLWGA